VLTAEYGRISLVARGARRRSRGGSSSALLQPFIPLLLSFSGRSELKTLTATETVGKVLMLRGERMFSGMYVNELLMRLLHQHDAHPQLFAAYARTLQALAGNEVVDTVLRHFEFTLLHELGYSIDLTVDGASGAAVREDLWYHYHPDFGMVARGDAVDQSRPAFAGSDLLIMAGGEFGGRVRLTAKRLLRQALATHLGDTPLRSRDLFRTAGAAPSLKDRVESVTGDKP
jgi:DNA repair protein RecO (recombination protein O)